MARYVSKRKIVEAVQFDPTGEHRLKLPVGVLAVYHYHGVADDYSYDGIQFSVVTMHGQETNVVAGDWIITEPDGIHHYPCKPEVFEKSYEPEFAP